MLSVIMYLVDRNVCTPFEISKVESHTNNTTYQYVSNDGSLWRVTDGNFRRK